MSEINGREAAVGDRILVGSQVGRITSYDELADRFVYGLTDGNGVNYVSGHISNTPFEVITPGDHTGLADKQSKQLDVFEKDVTFSSDPVEESPDTDRVKGKPGAKLPGRPDAESNDEFTTLGD